MDAKGEAGKQRAREGFFFFSKCQLHLKRLKRKKGHAICSERTWKNGQWFSSATVCLDCSRFSNQTQLTEEAAVLIKIFLWISLNDVGWKLEIIIRTWWVLRVSSGTLSKRTQSAITNASYASLPDDAGVTEISVVWLWSRDADVVRQLTFYFILSNWSGVCIASGAVPAREAARKTKCSFFQESFQALWTQLIQSQPLMLSTHQLGVYYLGLINWTCFIAQCVVVLVTQGSKVPLKKKPQKKNNLTFCAAALSFHQASTPTRVVLRLAPAITASKHLLIEESFKVLEGAENRNSGRKKIGVDKWRNGSNYVENYFQIQERFTVKKNK